METEKRIMELLWDLFNKMMWLNEQSLKKALNSYKPSEIHCIDYIGNHSEPNVTQLADAFYMTRGAISKLTKKLITKGLIESYQKTGNRKEIYFCLTEKGHDIFKKFLLQSDVYLQVFLYYRTTNTFIPVTKLYSCL